MALFTYFDIIPAVDKSVVPVTGENTSINHFCHYCNAAMRDPLHIDKKIEGQKGLLKQIADSSFLISYSDTAHGKCYLIKSSVILHRFPSS